MRDILKSYVAVLAPTIAAPVILYLLGMFTTNAFSAAALFKVGLLFGLYLLATRGLMTHFPAEHLRNRPLAILLEQNLLLGMVFAAGMTLMTDVLQLKQQQTLGDMLVSSAIMTVFFGGGMFVAALLQQRHLRQSDQVEL